MRKGLRMLSALLAAAMILTVFALPVLADENAELPDISAVFTVNNQPLSNAVINGLENATVTARVESSAAIDATLIMTLFKNDECLNSVTEKMSGTLANISLDGVTIPKGEAENYSIKLFTWSDLNTIKPLAEVIEANLMPSSILVDPTLEVDTEGVSYSTVGAAFNYLNANPPASENQRVTVTIAPGTYRDYFILSAPYVTLAAQNPENKPKLTFYYAAGLKYNTWIEENGALMGSTSDNPGTQQSASTTINGSAKDFTAKNIIFENSYNIELTDEEKADMIDDTSNISARQKDVTAQQKQAVAIRVSADRSIFENCEFYGRQDTLYIKDQSRIYFKDCYVEGTVDFIFGDAVAVFDNCIINSPYSAGYLTAGAHAAASPYGYLFWNCEMTREAKGGKSAPSNNTYYFGRPWNGPSSVAAVNCKIDSHVRTGENRFTEMSGIKPKDARWYEYNTMKLNGDAYPDSIYASYETVLTEDQVYSTHNPYNYLKAKYNKKTAQLDAPDGWDPGGYSNLKQAMLKSLANSIEVSGDILYGDIMLPTTFESNKDVNITWKSSNESVISNTGVVTLGESGIEPVAATLTATLSLDGCENEIRTFEVKIGTYEMALNSAVESVSVQSSVKSGYKLPISCALNGDVKIKWKSSNSAVTVAEDGTLSGAAGEQTVLTAELSLGSLIKTKDFNVSLVANNNNFEYSDSFMLPDGNAGGWIISSDADTDVRKAREVSYAVLGNGGSKMHLPDKAVQFVFDNAVTTENFEFSFDFIIDGNDLAGVSSAAYSGRSFRIYFDSAAHSFNEATGQATEANLDSAFMHITDIGGSVYYTTNAQDLGAKDTTVSSLNPVGGSDSVKTNMWYRVVINGSLTDGLNAAFYEHSGSGAYVENFSAGGKTAAISGPVKLTDGRKAELKQIKFMATASADLYFDNIKFTRK